MIACSSVRSTRRAFELVSPSQRIHRQPCNEPVNLLAAMLTADAPVAEMLAVIAQQTIGAFA
jgi:hypothetical protein